MKIFVEKNEIQEIKSNVMVLGLYEDEKVEYEGELGKLINDYILKDEGFKPKFGKIYQTKACNNASFDKLLVIGFGKKSEYRPWEAREIGSKIVKYLEKMPNSYISSIKIERNDNASFYDFAKAYAEGVLLGSYSFNKYKSKKDENEKKLEQVKFIFETEEAFQEVYSAVEYAKIVCEATNYARDLINEPAEVVTPEKLAEIAQGLEGVKVEIFDENKIKEMQMGAYYGVSKGSVRPPRFIHIKYVPQNAKKKIAIIGKGITFDSGGLDLKPASSMLTMKDDMSGAAAVISAIKAIVKLNLNVEVHAIVAACENMISGKAYKPGDILIAKNGKSIEIDNTDAEGRLTLADALCFADELEVDEIIDLATLTGACMVALGSCASGIFGNNELVEKIIKSGENSGEHFWKLPMFKEYKESLKSDIADMRNTGSRWGGASTAAVFL